MHVAVDQAGQQRAAREVDALATARKARLVHDGRDPAAFHDDGAAAVRITTRAVDESRTHQHEPAPIRRPGSDRAHEIRQSTSAMRMRRLWRPLLSILTIRI